MVRLLAVVILLIPLAIAPGLFFYYDVTPRVVLLLFGTSAAAVAWAVTHSTGIPRTSPAAKWFLIALCGMAASLVISTLASVNQGLSLGGSNWRYWGLVMQLTVLGFAFLMYAGCAGQAGSLCVILRAVALSGLAVAAYGIVQYFGWEPILNARAYHAGEGVFTIVRPPSTLGHADYSANWLLFVVSSSVALGSMERDRAWRWLAWVTVAAGSIAIVLSGTRAAMFGLVAGAAFLMAWRGFRINRRVLAASAAIPVAIVALYFSPAGAQMRARVHWALEEKAGGARLLLWRDSLRMGAARWWAGFGPDTYIDSFARYQSVELSRAFPDFYHESPHNILLDALVSQGVAGPLLLLGLAAAGFAAAWRMRRSEMSPIAGALAAGLAGMTLSAQFTCFIVPTALAYYVTIAMLVALASPAPAAAGISARRRWLEGAVATCAALVLAVFGVRLWMAETELAAVQRDLNAGSLDAAAARYAEYEYWRWPGGGADLWYSRRLAQIASTGGDQKLREQAFRQAAQAAERAAQTSEGAFNAYYNLAAFYARENDSLRTEQSLRAAIYGAPHWFKAHWMLARVLQSESRLEEAGAEAATAVSLDGGKHSEVTATLANVRANQVHASAELPHK